MIDHEWPETMNARAALGTPGNVRLQEVFAPDVLALAITAHLCHLSLTTGMGKKFRLGPLWWKRIEENAQGMQNEIDGM